MKVLLHICRGQAPPACCRPYAAPVSGENVVISDPREIRALAHPARITVLHHLYAGEVLTATECATLAGLTPSAMSYHLRSLERSGLIVRADPAGDGRERPWRARGTSIRVDHGTSSASRAAEGHLLRQVLDQLRIDLERTDTPGRPSTTGPEPGPAPVRGFTVIPATLTRDQAEDLMAQLNDLLRRYAPSPDPAPGSRYHVYWAVMPLENPPA